TKSQVPLAPTTAITRSLFSVAPLHTAKDTSRPHIVLHLMQRLATGSGSPLIPSLRSITRSRRAGSRRSPDLLLLLLNFSVHTDLMLVEAIHKIAHHRGSLSRDEARAVMGELLSGKATDAQIAALLVALHMKGETVEEIVGFAEAIRAAAQPL